MRSNCSRAASMAWVLAVVGVVPAEARLQPESASGARSARQTAEASSRDERGEVEERGEANIGSGTSIPRR